MLLNREQVSNVGVVSAVRLLGIVQIIDFNNIQLAKQTLENRTICMDGNKFVDNNLINKTCNFDGHQQ
jgi:hypothetical protein